MSLSGNASVSDRFTFVDVATIEDLKPGERIFVDTETQTIVIFNIAGEFFAIDDVCSHDQGPLGDGEVSNHEIHCPRHGASFDIRTGKVLSMPAITDIQAYPVRVTNGIVQLGLPVED